MRAAGCAAGGGPLSAAVAAASEEMVAKDSRLHLSTSALAAISTISLKCHKKSIDRTGGAVCNVSY